MAIAQSPVYAEVYEFLISAPTREELIAFRASEAVQMRVRELLEANKMNHLTAAEQAELDEFERVNHFVTILKVYARQQLEDE